MCRNKSKSNFATDGAPYIICTYVVTGADFENSLHAFGQSEKN